MAASVAVLKREGEERDAEGKKEKKRQEEEKAERREQKLRIEEEERARLAPACKEAVEKGLEHVLSLKNDVRKQILKIHFGVSAGVYKMKVADTEKALRELMQVTSGENNVLEANEDGVEATGLISEPMPELPPIEQEKLPIAEVDC